jgi:hypothetical protein
MAIRFMTMAPGEGGRVWEHCTEAAHWLASEKEEAGSSVGNSSLSWAAPERQASWVWYTGGNRLPFTLNARVQTICRVRDGKNRLRRGAIMNSRWHDENIPLDDLLGSPEQQEWVQVADMIRGHATRLAMIPDLKPEELKWLIDVSRAGISLEREARNLDRSRDPDWGSSCPH